MSEEGMYDTPRLILVLVSLIHTYGLHVDISLIIKLMHIPVETYLTIILFTCINCPIMHVNDNNQACIIATCSVHNHIGL